MTTYSSYSSSASATTWVTRPADRQLRLFLLSPAVVMAARVNQAVFQYPLAQVTFDTVTTGAYTDVKVGQTVLFGTAAGLGDLGRQRVRKATGAATLYVGRSSQGIRDGELDLQDNAYITVLNDYRVWSKPPYIDSGNVVYKDADLAFAGNGDQAPPVANGGAGVAATLDGGGKITVAFSGTASFAAEPGATITGYLWGVGDGTITVGTSTSSAITATFPAGFRWVSLTVTDSNGKTHVNRIPVFARDPDADACIQAFEVERHSITPAGQQLSVRIVEAIPGVTYPDGTLVLLWEGDPASASDRTNMLFIGWHQRDPAQIGATREGLLADVTLECVDAAGRLASLPIWTQEIVHDATPAAWNEMNEPNIDRFLHYLLIWHTTVLAVANFTWSGTGATYKFAIMGVNEGNLWDQLAGRAQVMTPDYLFTCDRLGRFAVKPDPMLQDSGDRTATVQAEITDADWADIRYTHQRAPRMHWLKSYAVVAGYAAEPTAILAWAPGTAPGQGATLTTRNNQLAPSQAILNACEGHRYARLNAFQSEFAVTLADFALARAIEPAALTWVELTITDAEAAPRGLSFTEERGLPKSLDIRYEHRREGLVRTATLVWERETEGTPAVTIPQVVDSDPPDTDWWPSVTPPPAIPPLEDLYYDPIKAYLLWDGAAVVRTWDILAGGGPTWERVDTGVTGDIYDAQQVMVDADTVGVWLLTGDGLWWCADIMATTPSWSQKLTLATVQATDPTVSGAADDVVIHGMTVYASNAGYVMLATGPSNAGLAATGNYAHTIFWYTKDYGASWHQVDLPNTKTQTGHTSGYWNAGRYGLASFRSSPMVYALRSTGYPVESTRVFVSPDWGATWDSIEIEAEAFGDSFSVTGAGGILTPYPDVDSLALVQAGFAFIGTPGLPYLYISNDGWASFTQQSYPSGYDGLSFTRRPNKRTFDNDHVIVVARATSDGQDNIIESEDQGATWTTLWDTGEANQSAQTPNGWPPDEDQWFVVFCDNRSLGDGVIVYTADRFATAPVSKEGNLSSVLPGAAWTSSASADGFALPKVGVNS